MNLILKGVDICLDGRQLFSQLSCTAEAGEVLSVLGSSGCGKSSLLNYICGILSSEFSCSGEIILAGRVINDIPSHQRGVGLQLQDHLLFPHMTVGENLTFALPRKYLRKERRKRVEQALLDCGLKGYFDRDPATLSGGQKARISLMRTLLAEPKLLLLDEPFSKLDAGLRGAFRRFVFEQIEERKIPALMVTHDEQDIPDNEKVIRL
ncbi:ATP-binding cassette domain-containing protein [uncultured Endozoicomonas sp.]|uniref:ATP-binding cassette domain-containing protein n=1 Tax=uncultured Endozoicomonas sp. TaxID=432652 RepID=UPI00263728FE|nr:ATP-binding cassette domain-containing protein [uncultured Endozoicomonas sp.]